MADDRIGSEKKVKPTGRAYVCIGAYPAAPSSSCRKISTTVRKKFGSRNSCEAINS